MRLKITAPLRRPSVTAAIVVVWPVVASATILAATGPTAPAFRQLFFVCLLLWPATFLAARYLGWSWSAAASVTLGGLVGVQACIPAPVPSVQPYDAQLRFSSSLERVRHEITLPVTSSAWHELWEVAPDVEAYVYVMLSESPAAADPELDLYLGGSLLSPLTAKTRLSSGSPNGERRFTWHRAPIERAKLAPEGHLILEVAPRPTAALGPDAAAIVGGFSFNATLPPTPSAYFDGSLWTHSIARALPIPQTYRLGVYAPSMPWRYYIEVRIVDTASSRVRDIYY